MELGAFSISLAVNNLEASKSFYEKFGFKLPVKPECEGETGRRRGTQMMNSSRSSPRTRV
jgi:predicted lactoylglutathione lyase